VLSLEPLLQEGLAAVALACFVSKFAFRMTAARKTKHLIRDRPLNFRFNATLGLNSTTQLRNTLVAKMKFSDIKTNSQYLRLDSNVDMLVKSIEQVGLIHPLSVNENNELLAGGRRYCALEILGWKEVEVTIVNKSELEQELISIDENLVRKSLSKLQFEKCLNRGRSIYEELTPSASKISMDTKKLTTAEKSEKKEQEIADKTSFAAINSEKLGLSKSVISGAIKRDALSSKKVKEARSQGEINAGQANELIRMSKAEQDKVLPHIKQHSIKEIRKLIDTVSDTSVEEAIEADKKQAKLPTEYVQFINLSKRLNKTLAKILLEQMTYTGLETNKIANEAIKLTDHLSDFLALQSNGSLTIDSTEEDSDIVDGHIAKMNLDDTRDENHAGY
jgi:ParB family chromosome partitioning protein